VTPLDALNSGLSAVLNGGEPTAISRRAAVVAGAVGTAPGFAASSLAPLGSAVEPLPSRFSTQQLVDLLKTPTCVAPARRPILDYLEFRYGRPFHDQWEFVEYAGANLPEIDLTTPPKRPGR
jgi:hypothetical protein